MKSLKLLNIMLVGDLVDKLGELRAAQAEIKKEADKIEEALKTSVGNKEGTLFDAVVFDSDRETVDWKAIANKVGYSVQLKTANTKKSVTRTLKVTAKKLAKAA